MKPWPDDVKQTGKLTVYLGTLAGTWAHVVREALRDFNSLISANKISLTFVESKDAPEVGGGAQVSVDVVDGAIGGTYGGQDLSEAFDGKRLHGRTQLITRQSKDLLEKVFVHLPAQPQVNTPSGQRGVGTNVMKVIAAHELIHACGLENRDHSNDDLFQGNPVVDFGSRPQQDKILIGTGPRKMPPLILSGSTVQKIMAAWST